MQCTSEKLSIAKCPQLVSLLILLHQNEFFRYASLWGSNTNRTTVYFIKTYRPIWSLSTLINILQGNMLLTLVAPFGWYLYRFERIVFRPVSVVYLSLSYSYLQIFTYLGTSLKFVTHFDFSVFINLKFVTVGDELIWNSSFQWDIRIIIWSLTYMVI